MFVHPYGLPQIAQGEPTAEAHFREEYYAEKHSDSEESEIVEPSFAARAALLRAQVIAGVGRFFA